MKRVLPVLLALLFLLTLPAYAADGKLTATAAESGDKVTVTVRLQNPGIIATRIFVRYDPDVLQLTGAQNGEVFQNGNAMFGKDVSVNPYTMLWDDSLRHDNITQSGTLCTVTFTVKNGTESGKTSVRFAVDDSSTFDVDLNDVKIAECSCSVDVPVVTTKSSGSTTASTTKAVAPANDTTTTRQSHIGGSPSGSVTTTKTNTTAATKPAVTTKPAATAKPAATTKAAATTKPASLLTTKAAVTMPSVTVPDLTSALKLPDEVASAVSSAASSAAASVKEKAEAAAEIAASTAAQPDASVPNGTTVPAADEPTDALPADGTVSETGETTQELLTDPQTSSDHRGLLWLLLLIPAAAAVVIVIVKKKK